MAKLEGHVFRGVGHLLPATGILKRIMLLIAPRTGISIAFMRPRINPLTEGRIRRL